MPQFDQSVSEYEHLTAKKIGNRLNRIKASESVAQYLEINYRF